ncbi:hypothetical protein BK009_00925 [Methanobacterium subterraneum]|uniref:Uncharacterized protein n=1 Tax=Methanobacterium subterraneum TaxID=59277 RepID=A0A2H4VMT3_9EURY|nr:hypothetical protein [Methanobacterium subterraneum]AUB59366.1 hypothetical protein BK009_00925 [Methanobacterium subterraneum]
MTAVRHFILILKYHYLECCFQYVEIETASKVVSKRSPGINEIKYALQFAKPRMTAIILTIASSGMIFQISLVLLKLV